MSRSLRSLTNCTKKRFKNVKNRFRVALKSMETRKSQLCPSHIGRALATYYGDIFYIPKSLPCCQKKMLLIALLSEENFANSLAVSEKKFANSKK